MGGNLVFSELYILTPSSLPRASFSALNYLFTRLFLGGGHSKDIMKIQVRINPILYRCFFATVNVFNSVDKKTKCVCERVLYDQHFQ